MFTALSLRSNNSHLHISISDFFVKEFSALFVVVVVMVCHSHGPPLLHEISGHLQACGLSLGYGDIVNGWGLGMVDLLQAGAWSHDSPRGQSCHVGSCWIQFQL